MLKAGALYFAIVIAFFLAVISASLIMLAAHYRGAYLKEIRFNRLLNNSESGVAYILADENGVGKKQNIDLYGDQMDSIAIFRKQWGIFELAVLRTSIAQDTLKKAFLIGTGTDSTVLYLSDEDRPLSLSGNTMLSGNVEVPKSGLKQSYAEGKPYSGKQLVYGGETTNSKRTLKPLSPKILRQLDAELRTANSLPLLSQKELTVSFQDSTQKYKLRNASVLENVNLNGNIVLYSDSALTIGATAKLNDVLVYSKSIRVEDGFKGNVQLFATDSIVVSKDATLNYPSVLGIMKGLKADGQPHITLGENVVFNGIIFTYEEKRSAMQTLISLGKGAKVRGEVYSTGFVKLGKKVSVDGKVSCNRFIMQTPTTLYENFLIDVAFDRKSRSPYYLSSQLFPGNRQNGVLKWLN